MADERADPGDADEGETLIGLAVRLVDDGKRFARAEIALYRAKVSARLGAFKTAAALLVAAGLIAFAALIALLVALVMLLAPWIGMGWATLIVVGGAFLIAAILGRIGVGHLRAALASREDQP